MVQDFGTRQDRAVDARTFDLMSESMPEGRRGRFRRWKKLWRASRAHWTLGKSSETTPAHWGSFAQSTQESIRKTEGTGQLTWGSFAQSTQEVESGELPQAGNYIYKSYQHPDASPQNSGTKPTLPACSFVLQLVAALEPPMLPRLSDNRCT